MCEDVFVYAITDEMTKLYWSKARYGRFNFVPFGPKIRIYTLEGQASALVTNSNNSKEYLLKNWDRFVEQNNKPMWGRSKFPEPYQLDLVNSSLRVVKFKLVEVKDE